MEVFDVSMLKAGKQEVYEQLFAALYGPLCNYAASILKNMEEAEETVQNTFCKLWDLRAEIDIKTSIKSYMYRIVHNECMNRLRQIKNHAEHNFQYAQSKGEKNNDLEENIFGSELEIEIHKTINALPPRCREVFLKSRIGNLSYSKIAAELNISVNTVENQMVKALRILRESLKDYMPVVWLLIFI